MNLLAEIMDLFSQEEFITNIRNAESKEEIIKLFSGK